MGSNYNVGPAKCPHCGELNPHFVDRDQIHFGRQVNDCEACGEQYVYEWKAKIEGKSYLMTDATVIADFENTWANYLAVKKIPGQSDKAAFFKALEVAIGKQYDGRLTDGLPRGFVHINRDKNTRCKVCSAMPGEPCVAVPVEPIR